jgi:hypothetical protein
VRRRILERLGVRPNRDEATGTDDGSTGFDPPPLDRSVRYAHRGNDDVERELAAVRERPETLEERRRGD